MRSDDETEHQRFVLKIFGSLWRESNVHSVSGVGEESRCCYLYDCVAMIVHKKEWLAKLSPSFGDSNWAEKHFIQCYLIFSRLSVGRQRFCFALCMEWSSVTVSSGGGAGTPPRACYRRGRWWGAGLRGRKESYIYQTNKTFIKHNGARCWNSS